MMNDMAVVVHKSGDNVELICDLAEKGDKNIDTVVKDLTQAKQYKSKSMKFCIIMFIALIAIIVLIWITIFFSK